MNQAHTSAAYKKQTTYYLIAVGALCIAIAIFLGAKIFHDLRHEPRPIPREARIDLISGWMTIRYISRIYDVPEEILIGELHLTSEKYDRLNLMKIAKEQGKTTDEVINQVRTIIGIFHQGGVRTKP